jgi:glycosyltransferase involved in cell wall biosynthesis
VIARSGTGVEDFVEDGREGLLGRSTEDLVTALVSLGRRRTLRERISAHNRSVPPAEFSWPVVLDRLRTCYDDAARRVVAAANGEDTLG